MTDSREVEFFQVSEQRNVLDEIADERTRRRSFASSA